MYAAMKEFMIECIPQIREQEKPTRMKSSWLEWFSYCTQYSFISAQRNKAEICLSVISGNCPEAGAWIGFCHRLSPSAAKKLCKQIKVLLKEIEKENADG